MKEGSTAEKHCWKWMGYGDGASLCAEDGRYTELSIVNDIFW